MMFAVLRIRTRALGHNLLHHLFQLLHGKLSQFRDEAAVILATLYIGYEFLCVEIQSHCGDGVHRQGQSVSFYI